jgi:hypothetical protein
VAAILAARKLASIDPRPSPALNFAIADAVEKAEQILQRIDSVWPGGESWLPFKWAEGIMRKIMQIACFSVHVVQILDNCQIMFSTAVFC